MKETVLNYVIEFAFVIITAVATKVIIPAIAAWLKSKTDNENMKTVFDDLANTVAICVDNLEQTAVAQYKASGEWNADTQKAVCDMAVESICENLLELTKRTLTDNGIDLSSVVRKHVEAYIQSKKQIIE